MVKKIVTAIILGSLVVGLTGCGGSSETSDNNVAKQEQSKQSETKQDESKNLGISVKQVEEKFKEKEFTFENSPLDNGTARLMGKSPEEKGNAILELQGKDKLLNTTLLIMASKDDIKNNAYGVIYATLLVKTICPNFDNFTDWFDEELRKIVKDPDAKAEKVVGDKTIKMKFLKEIGTIQILIQPN